MKKVLLLGLLLSLLSTDLPSQDYELRDVATNLTIPWEILWGPDDYIWYTERVGRVGRVNPETGDRETILDITNRVQTGSERGLMGMVLSPDFENDKQVYISFTYQDNGTKIRIERYTYSDGILKDPVEIIGSILGGAIHDGSRLAFGPDGKLYATFGEAGIIEWSQDLRNVNGKILRLNPDGSFPEDNPDFGGQEHHPAIYSWGHRNPQGLVFHGNTLYSSEHGQNIADEINVIEAGRNYGWPSVEGFCDEHEMQFCEENNIKEPFAQYYETRTAALCGIDFYDINSSEPNFIPEFNNSLIMTSLKDSRLYVLPVIDGSAGEDEIIIDKSYGRLRDVCISPDGRVFFATSNRDGRIGGDFPKALDDRIVELKLKTSSVESEDSNILVYPNPAKNYINLRNAEGVNSIKIYNSIGVMVREYQEYLNEIDISNLSPGKYFIKLNRNNSDETLPFTVIQ